MSRVVLTSLAPTVILSSLTGHSFSLVSSPGSVAFTVAGPKGEEGQGIVWRGDYVASTHYVPMDAVLYNGSSYLCEVACTGVEPTETSNWSLLAAAGGSLETIDGGLWV